MSVIYKYSLTPSWDVQHISVPKGSETLSVIEQDGGVVVYILSSKAYLELAGKNAKALAPKRFLVVGTGWSIDKNLGPFTFIGSVKIDSLVFHVLELIE